MPRKKYGDALSPREEEVLALLLTGSTNQEIADRLFVTRKSITFHVTNILRKLNAKRRHELIARQGVKA